MKIVASIVEGHGEVSAVQVLLRRLSGWLTPHVSTRVLTPIRVHRDQFLNKGEEFSRYLKLAGAKCGQEGWVLVLLDADDDCPATTAPAVLARAQLVLPGIPVSVVLAKREYEAWFIASASSLNGVRGFKSDGDPVADPESIANAKGWIKLHMPDGAYGETTDQAALTAGLNLEMTHDGSPSFNKLCREWKRHVGEHVEGE